MSCSQERSCSPASSGILMRWSRTEANHWPVCSARSSSGAASWWPQRRRTKIIPPAVAGKVSAVAATIPGVGCVEKCIARKMGYHFFVDMHVEVDPQMSVQRGHQIAHEVKDKVRAQVPEVYDVLVHIEPSRSEVKK